jgi:hypothetical protein
MSWLVDNLRNSRIAGVIGQVERGEQVDVDRLLLLQTLDIVHAGQLFLADAIERETELDDRAIAAAKGL